MDRSGMKSETLSPNHQSPQSTRERERQTNWQKERQIYFCDNALCVMEAFRDQFGIWGVHRNFGVKNERHLCFHCPPVQTWNHLLWSFSAPTKPSHVNR